MKAVRGIVGTCVPLDRSDVDTDQIIPASWLKRVERTGFGVGLFSAWRESDPSFPLNLPEYQGASILVAGPNFGVGSSREHAVWALTDFGFRCVISPGFADIFYNNSLKNGLLPVALPEDVVNMLWDLTEEEPTTAIQVDLASQTVTLRDGQTHHFDIDPFRRLCLLNGVDDLGYIMSKEAAIAAHEAVPAF